MAALLRAQLRLAVVGPARRPAVLARRAARSCSCRSRPRATSRWARCRCPGWSSGCWSTRSSSSRPATTSGTRSGSSATSPTSSRGGERDQYGVARHRHRLRGATLVHRRLRPSPLPHHQRLLRRQPHASRRGWNASAIGGEYLSAASFLGIAGLVYALGADMLWFPVGYTVGYLVLLVLVAAPLRRSGAYTLPDFAEARLESRRGAPAVRRPRRRHRLALPAAAVPGRRAGAAAPSPAHRRWLGGLIVAVVVLANVARAACARSPSSRPCSTGSSSPPSASRRSS